MDVNVKVRDLIYNAFKSAGIVSAYEEIDDNEAQDALVNLNEMISKFNHEKLFFIVNKKTEIQTDGSDYYYLDCLTTEDVDSVYFQNDKYFNKLKELSKAEYEANKYNKSDIPMGYLLTFDYKLSTLSIIDKNVIGKLIINKTGKLQYFETLDEEVDMLDLWVACLRYSLAVRLCSEYGRQVPDFVLSESVAMKELLKDTMKSKEQPQESFVAYEGCIPRFY